MPKIYTNQTNATRIREPLFNIERVKYKSPRSSQQENVESNFLKLDISRISKELDEIDLTVIDNLTYLIGDITDITDSVKLNDGLSYSITGVNLSTFGFKDPDVELPNTQVLSIDVTNKLGAKLARLFNKVTRLESEM
jgi:hypothetical protein